MLEEIQKGSCNAQNCCSSMVPALTSAWKVGFRYRDRKIGFFPPTMLLSYV